MSCLGRVACKIANSRRVRAARRGVQNWWRSLDADPYVVHFHAPDSLDISALRMHDIRGLLAVHTFVPDQQPAPNAPAIVHVVAYWKSEPAYRASQTLLCNRLNISPPGAPIAQGRQRQHLAKPEKYGWIGRHLGLVIGSLIGFLGTLAAFVGNVEKIRDPVFALAQAPSVTVAASREKLDVLAGEEFEAEFSIKNTSDWISCSLDFNDIKIEPKEAVTIDTPTPGPYIDFRPGAVESLKVHGITRNQDLALLTEISFDVSSRNWANYDPGDGTNVVIKPPLRVFIWPRRTVGIKEVGQVLLAGKRCRMDCEFMIGEEFISGLEIQAQLKNPDDVQLDRIQFPGSPGINRLSNSPFIPFEQIRWTANDLTPRKRYQFTVFLSGQRARSADEWKDLVKRVEIAFGSVRKK